MLVLSTMHHDDLVDGDTQKSEIILYYNSTKSVLDNLDHLTKIYTSRRKINLWPVALFGNVVDIGAVAAFIVWLGNFPQWQISEGKTQETPLPFRASKSSSHATYETQSTYTHVVGTDREFHEDDWS